MNRLSRMTLYVLGCLLAAALLLSLPACEAPTTPQEKEQISALDVRIDEAIARMKALEGDAKEQAALLVDQDATNNDAAGAALRSIHAEYVALSEQLQADLESRGAIIDTAGKRVTNPFVGGLSTMFPAWAPLIGAGGALASRLVTKRGREHAKATLEALLRARVGEGVGAFLKYLGYSHSNDDPVAVLGGAEAAAKEKGKQDEAARIAALRAELEAKRQGIATGAAT